MDSLICPAPPTNHAEISGEMLQSLVVPTPSGKQLRLDVLIIISVMWLHSFITPFFS